MAMNELWSVAFAVVAGALLGAMFYGGLWWTVHRGVSSKRVALWFLGGLLLRMSIALSGIYFVAGGHWERLLLCLLGFVVIRPALIWLTRPSREDDVLHALESRRAP